MFMMNSISWMYLVLLLSTLTKFHHTAESKEQMSPEYKAELERIAKKMRDEYIPEIEKDETGGFMITDEETKQSFDDLDENNDAYLDRDELFKLIKTTLTNNTDHALQFVNNLLANDKNGDQRINYDEYYELSLKSKQAYKDSLKSKCQKDFKDSTSFKELEDLKKDALSGTSSEDKDEDSNDNLLIKFPKIPSPTNEEKEDDKPEKESNDYSKIDSVLKESDSSPDKGSNGEKSQPLPKIEL